MSCRPWNITRQPWAVAGVAIVLLLLGSCSRGTFVPLRTGSMYPTLEKESQCVLQPLADAPPLEIGHVVTVELEGQVVMRRVAGLPGDEIVPDGGLYRRKGVEPDRDRLEEATMCLLGPSPRCICELWEERVGTRTVKVQRLSRRRVTDDIRCDAPMETAQPVVPDGHVFVLADNRDGAFDSRDLGAVPRSQIKARVLRCR